MTLEDAERLFGRPNALTRLRRRGADRWLDERARPGRTIPAWAPVAAASVVGFAVGLAVLSARRATLRAIAALPGDWLHQLQAEDRVIDALLEAGSRTPAEQANRRALLLARVAYSLVRLGLQKEWAIYPAIDEVRGNGEAEALAAGQHEIKTRLHGLAETPHKDAKWTQRWMSLAKRVREQMNDEARILPALYERLSSNDNAQLTRLMQRATARLG